MLYAILAEVNSVYVLCEDTSLPIVVLIGHGLLPGPSDAPRFFFCVH